MTYARARSLGITLACLCAVSGPAYCQSVQVWRDWNGTFVRLITSPAVFDIGATTTAAYFAPLFALAAQPKISCSAAFTIRPLVFVKGTIVLNPARSDKCGALRLGILDLSFLGHGANVVDVLAGMTRAMGPPVQTSDESETDYRWQLTRDRAVMIAVPKNAAAQDEFSLQVAQRRP